MLLREVRDEDLPAIFEQQRDPASVAMAGVPARTRAEFDAHWEIIRTDPAMILRVIEVDGAVAGTAASFVQEGRRVVGYWIDREFWGRGIASAALGALLAEDPERPLYATVLLANEASRRVLEKHGFAHESDDGELALYALTSP